MNGTYKIKASSLIRLLVVILFIFMLFNIIRNVKEAAAENNSDRFVCTSIRIGDGDTLWSIAEDYYTEDYRSIETYIKEIKKANNLKGNTIHAGNYLIVPRYMK